jgi:hypothetical protein
MKTFRVSLTKSFLVTINAENEQDARHFAEFYTSDVKDISTDKDRQNEKFVIEEIECKINEGFEVEEVISQNL